MFRKALELSSEDAVAPLEFPDSKIQREEEFDARTRDVPENIESPLEELLEVPPSKRSLLGTKRRYKKPRSIKLLQGLSEKA